METTVDVDLRNAALGVWAKEAGTFKNKVVPYEESMGIAKKVAVLMGQSSEVALSIGVDAGLVETKPADTAQLPIEALLRQEPKEQMEKKQNSGGKMTYSSVAEVVRKNLELPVEQLEILCKKNGLSYGPATIKQTISNEKRRAVEKAEQRSESARKANATRKQRAATKRQTAQDVPTVKLATAPPTAPVSSAVPPSSPNGSRPVANSWLEAKILETQNRIEELKKQNPEIVKNEELLAALMLVRNNFDS